MRLRGVPEPEKRGVHGCSQKCSTTGRQLEPTSKSLENAGKNECGYNFTPRQYRQKTGFEIKKRQENALVRDNVRLRLHVKTVTFSIK